MIAAAAYERLVDDAAGRYVADRWRHVRLLAKAERATAIVAECDRMIARLTTRT